VVGLAAVATERSTIHETRGDASGRLSPAGPTPAPRATAATPVGSTPRTSGQRGGSVDRNGTERHHHRDKGRRATLGGSNGVEPCPSLRNSLGERAGGRPSGSNGIGCRMCAQLYSVAARYRGDRCSDEHVGHTLLDASTQLSVPPLLGEKIHCRRLRPLFDDIEASGRERRPPALSAAAVAVVHV
jgi:hypothetical protein